MNTLNLHNQPVEKEHVLPNLYDFWVPHLNFSGCNKAPGGWSLCLAKTKSSIEVSGKKHKSARNFKENNVNKPYDG